MIDGHSITTMSEEREHMLQRAPCVCTANSIDIADHDFQSFFFCSGRGHVHPILTRHLERIETDEEKAARKQKKIVIYSWSCDTKTTTFEWICEPFLPFALAFLWCIDFGAYVHALPKQLGRTNSTTIGARRGFDKMFANFSRHVVFGAAG